MKRVHHVFEFTRSMAYPSDEIGKAIVNRLATYSADEVNSLIEGCQELIDAAREGCTVGDEENDL